MSSRSRFTIVRRVAGIAGAMALVSVLVWAYGDWCPSERRAADAVQQWVGAGPLRVGAAKLPLMPAFPAPVAGYPAPRGTADRPQVPLFARAMVIEAAPVRVAIASVELLLI